MWRQIFSWLVNAPKIVPVLTPERALDIAWDSGVRTVVASFVASEATTMAAWPDETGGWYYAADEYATDGGLHLTVWSWEPGGRARRLACDPQAGRSTSVGAV